MAVEKVDEKYRCMARLKTDVIDFFNKQTFTIISTIDKKGLPHNACKGIIKINQKGEVYLLDLYRARTFKNLTDNPHIAVTAVDEHKFKGFTLKGKARIVSVKKLLPSILKAWEKKIATRATRRVIRNMQGNKGHSRHLEVLLPSPAYMIIMQVNEVIDLTPHHLK